MKYSMGNAKKHNLLLSNALDFSAAIVERKKRNSNVSDDSHPSRFGSLTIANEINKIWIPISAIDNSLIISQEL